MRTFRIIGATGVATILLSSSIALAAPQTASSTKPNGESIQERFEATREKSKQRMETLQEKASKRLEDIEDKPKQQLAQKLVTQFDNQNTVWTDQFMKTLEQYDVVLAKIQARADIAKGRGKDITSTTAAIQSAKTAIATARTAVTAQAGKTYTINTATIPVMATSTPTGQEKLMKGLRESFKSVHTSLFKDLFALRDGPMKNARKSVQTALQTLSKVKGVDDDSSATATTTQKSTD